MPRTQTTAHVRRRAGSLRIALAGTAGVPLPAAAEGWGRMPELLVWAIGSAVLLVLLLTLLVRLIEKGGAALVPNPWLRPLLRNTLMFGAVAVTVYLVRGGELAPNMTIGVAAIVIVLKTLTDMLGSVGSALPPRRRKPRGATRQDRQPPER